MAAERNRQPRVDLAGFTAWAVPALLIVFLGLSNGGFDPIARGEVGAVVWWLVLIGTALNLLPAGGGTLAGRVLLAIAVAFAAWTALGLTWTESDERTATEVARVSGYLAVFTLALGVQGTGRWRQVLHGATFGAVALCAIAVLSRMEPPWFPEQRAGEFLTGIQIESRLAYPINYPSGLGALAAISLPLAFGATATARTIPGQALAAAAMPVVALSLWLTSSGLSVPALCIALLLFVFLAPDRIPKFATLLVAAAGSAVLFAAVDQRPDLDQGLAGATALEQGDELLVITLVVCAGVGLIQAGISAWTRYARRPRWMQVPRRTAAVATGALALVAVVGGIAAGGADQLSDEWNDIKSRGASVDPRGSSRAAEILDFSGSGRYDFWTASVDANKTDPLKGTGPGTFDLWWERSGYYEAYVRDGHSLYLETLGELGIVGFLLVVVLVGGILVVGAVRAWRAPPELRAGLAAATAGCTAFAAAALVDWVWELGALAVTFFALAAVAVAGGARPAGGPVGVHHAPPWWRRHGGRIAVCVLAVCGIAAIAQPLWGAIELEHSFDDAGVGRYQPALDNARDAADIQPYTATPYMQQALLLEHDGELGAAADAARTATENEPTNWLTWHLLSQIEEERGHKDAAAQARRQSVSVGGPRQ
jgi:hypothetical protein